MLPPDLLQRFVDHRKGRLLHLEADTMDILIAGNDMLEGLLDLCGPDLSFFEPVALVKGLQLVSDTRLCLALVKPLHRSHLLFNNYKRGQPAF